MRSKQEQQPKSGDMWMMRAVHQCFTDAPSSSNTSRHMWLNSDPHVASVEVTRTSRREVACCIPFGAPSIGSVSAAGGAVDVAVPKEQIAVDCAPAIHGKSEGANCSEATYSCAEGKQGVSSGDATEVWCQ